MNKLHTTSSKNSKKYQFIFFKNKISKIKVISLHDQINQKLLVLMLSPKLKNNKNFFSLCKLPIPQICKTK